MVRARNVIFSTDHHARVSTVKLCSALDEDLLVITRLDGSGLIGMHNHSSDPIIGMSPELAIDFAEFLAKLSGEQIYESE